MKRWYFPIERVPQRDDHGCGIAAVATVCGVTYNRARSEFFPCRRKFHDDQSLHVNQHQIVRAVRRLGFSVVVGDRFKRQLRWPTIAFFSWVPGAKSSDNNVHALVWDPFAKRLIDVGYDHDRGLSNDFYLGLVKRSNYRSLVVTGKRR
jgi:hypothetical protein